MSGTPISGARVTFAGRRHCFNERLAEVLLKAVYALYVT
jgi:hypothetical protein